jgi:hypothetical protein
MVPESTGAYHFNIRSDRASSEDDGLSLTFPERIGAYHFDVRSNQQKARMLVSKRK